ncbi:hypothetical protein NIES4103_12270 [Nostoc sp. NIES-4103]|nr:hypothetical protein NIES4103_12270 [Nostoc sp. NIES-4103]
MASVTLVSSVYETYKPRILLLILYKTTEITILNALIVDLHNAFAVVR